MASAASEPQGRCWDKMPQAAKQLLRRRGCETASDVAFMFGDQNAVRKFCKELALNDEDDICIMVAAWETASMDAEIQIEATRHRQGSAQAPAPSCQGHTWACNCQQGSSRVQYPGGCQGS